MGIVLRGFQEELVAVGQMVLGAGCRGGERRLDAVGMGQFEGSVDLVGRDVIEALALVLLGKALPIEFRGLEQRERAHHVGLCENEGVLDATVHMALSCQVDDAIDLFLLHQAVEGVEIADVHLHELIVGLLLDVLQVGQIAGVGEFVEVDDVVVGILVHEMAHHVAPDKACAAGNYYIALHTIISSLSCSYIF